MLVRFIVIGVFIAILASLFSGMYFMIHDKSGSIRNVKSLSIRIGLSLLLFALLVGLYVFGYIKPNSVHP